ncbi:MAG: cytochrome c oxidase accessory protein CcoG [Betaproteobacteria bacterium]|nr:cytochrome c oxidase accessory protein CcoG [Betaproteobacteria bacterium]
MIEQTKSNSPPRGEAASGLVRPRRVVPVVPAAEQGDEVDLYEVRKKIHPRAVTGWFANWRWVLVLFTQLLFYGLPWWSMHGRQAVLFELEARKFYLFGWVFWPQDVVFLAVLLVLAALALFLFTAVAGRLFCGYACPQTVYTEIFMWIESRIEGDRPARMRLDREPWGPRKLAIKVAKHLVWASIAFWTGFTFVGYFTPISALGQSVLSLSLGPWETFWILFYGFATYGNAGWLREQVCIYMCPYARFQSVMFDRDTLIITYDEQRGDPRGRRGKKTDPRAAGLGDCIDCKICVQVCPTGIDIRDGLQYQCIGCAACIDACDQVMDKMAYPRGLIRYATENALAEGLDRGGIWRRVPRPRVLVYAALVLFVAIGLVAGLALRNPLKVDIIRDRGALAREVAPGLIENVYRLQVTNTEEEGRRYRIGASGLPGIKVIGVEQPIEVAAASTVAVPLRLQVAQEMGKPGSNPILFHIESVDGGGRGAAEKSVFILPRS